MTSTNTETISEKEAGYLETYGWIISQQSGITQFGLNNEELALIIKGIKTGYTGEQAAQDPQLVTQEMQDYLKKRAEENIPPAQKAAMTTGVENAKKNIADGKAFIKNKVSENINVKGTESGLHYEIHTAGSDAKPTATDQVKVHYEGKLIDGSVFDSSIARGEPITFGLNQVIKGWTEGLQLIGEGGKITLYIPSDIAYGNSDQSSIPGGSTLVFEVELITINP
jgi:FKBP-type peptidyl-prolyl cis-trans isomerase